MASAPLPTPGKIMTYKDWTVGCDNGLACQAVALKPDGPWDDGLSVVITRKAGLQALPAVEISGFPTKLGRFRLLLDGKAVETGTIETGAESITFTDGKAIKLSRALAKGSSLSLVDASGAKFGAASLSGIAAALRYVDSTQGRAGSKGAILATGARKASVKKAVLPVLEARKIKPSDMLPDASALVALSEGSPCAQERFGSTEDTAYSLGNGPAGAQSLVMLNCGAGAYNFSSGIYVGQRSAAGKWNFEPAKFDYGASGFSPDSKIPILVNADWDAATQTISSFSKGRGVGDCGSSESWVWDGAVFRLTSATAMGECRGSVDWIPIWRAEVKLLP
jgi:Protein of unknown function (DUF1176)